MTTKTLLELRKKISKKRPKFRQTDHQKRPKLDPTKWRRPKGMHNKIRHGFNGQPAKVNGGYRGPKEVRGLHNSGLIPVLVHNVKDLTTIDTKTQGVIIAHVGNRTKSQILTQCKEKKINVLNVKNVDDKLKGITDKITARKETKAELRKRKTAKEKKKETKPEKTKEEPKTKEEERKEMEKVLTQKE